MPLLLDTPRSGSIDEMRGSNCLTVGLVNNMPDAAVETTERQFRNLLGAAAGDTIVRLKLFFIPEVPRSAEARNGLAARCRHISEVWNTRLDGLIVTGTEPRAANLADEPYWPALIRLVDWARENTVSTIWSCLAAHAAVLYADTIERRWREEKLFGLFDCEVVAAHPLVSGAPPRLRVPHSRYNDLPEASLAASGYRILTRSAATGADSFVKEGRGASLFLFFQGHPEYESDTLIREYRRDIGRFLRGEREHLPATPQGCFEDNAAALIDAFRARAVRDRRESLVADFPISVLGAAMENAWRPFAIRVYRNWIDILRNRKPERRGLMPRMQSYRGQARRNGDFALAGHDRVGR